MIEPSAIVLYVNHLTISSQFYKDLLGLKPQEDSPTFHSFTLATGMGLALKAKHSVEPPACENGNCELAFVVSNKNKVDELFLEWQKKEMRVAQIPTDLPFGYTFVALDPDGHRLRVISLQNH